MSEITYLTPNQYSRRLQQLSAASKRAYLRYCYWNDEQYLRPFGSTQYRRALEALDKAWHTSIDAGNALAHFERTHRVKETA